MLPTDLAFAPVDSTRVVAHVYSASLLALGPIAVAGLAACALRQASAGTRVLVWRAAVVAILLLCLGQVLPGRWAAWIVPEGLADPLIALGRLRLSGTAPASAGAWITRALCLLYVGGLLLGVGSLARECMRTRRLVASSEPIRDPEWVTLFAEVRDRLGVHRSVRLVTSSEVHSPLAAGVFRPAVVLPPFVLGWAAEHRRAILLHELAHVRSGDIAAAVAGRVACALLWFHPGAWWVGQSLRAECEAACDDRVLSARVRPSAYATLLVAVADAVGEGKRRTRAAAAISDGGLRRRLAAITTLDRDLRPASRARARVAFALAVAIALPLGMIRLEPTHAVLQDLLRNSHWDARAYAVLSLAPRADSINVTRAAAASDPDPLVRAWASYALAQRTPGLPVMAPAGVAFPR